MTTSTYDWSRVQGDRHEAFSGQITETTEDPDTQLDTTGPFDLTAKTLSIRFVVVSPNDPDLATSLEEACVIDGDPTLGNWHYAPSASFAALSSGIVHSVLIATYGDGTTKTFPDDPAQPYQLGYLIPALRLDPSPPAVRPPPRQIIVGPDDGADINTARYLNPADAFQVASDRLAANSTPGGKILYYGANLFDRHGLTLGDYVDLAGVDVGSTLEWVDGCAFDDTTPGVNFLVTAGTWSRLNGVRFLGAGNYTCPINGVDTINAAGTNTRGSALLVPHPRVVLDQINVEGFAEHGIVLNGTGPTMSVQGTALRVKGCGGIGFDLHAWATDGEIGQLWVGACARNVDLLNSELAIGALHTWGSATYGLVFDGPVGGAVRIGSAYVETNAGWGIYYNNTHRNHIGRLELWANGLGGLAGGIKLTDSTGNTIDVCSARNNIGTVVLSNGASFDNRFRVIQRDEYAALNDSSATITHAATVSQGDTHVTFSDSPLDRGSPGAPSKHVHCWLVLPGAGTGGATLTSARIVSVEDANHCTIDTAVPTGVTGAAAVIHATHDGIWEATNSTTLDTAATPNAYSGSIPVRQILSSQVFVNTTSTVENMQGVNPQGRKTITSTPSGAAIDTRLASDWDVRLTTDAAITFFGPSPILVGQTARVMLRQDSIGNRVPTWPSNIKFAGGTFTPSLTAGYLDVLEFRYDGTNWNEVRRSLGVH